MAIRKGDFRPHEDNYDHGPLTTEALAHPGEWFTDDAENYPVINPSLVRSGAMKDYRPAGAFTARRRAGVHYVAFLGVPKQPWSPDDAGSFDTVERTLNPDKCPSDTPERVLQALRDNRQREAGQVLERAGIQVESKADKKARKKKKAKKHKS